jgi:hypothetical protein
MSWQWKDEDEYAHAVATGTITPTDAAAVADARDQALALVESAIPPFTPAAVDWRPSPTWPTPTLPTAHALPPH